MRKILNSMEGLRVLMYARYSTDKQNEHSIDAQFSMLRGKLKEMGWKNCQVNKVHDDGISGAVLSRPGIDEVKNLIETRQVDVVIAEDISRFYRDEIFFGLLVKTATDHGVRIIAVNDGFDSIDESSRMTYLIKAAQHAMYRQDTARRIKRSQLELFRQGYATGPVPVGCYREPVKPVKSGIQKGPWVDKRNDELTPIIREIFERVARGDSLKSVAEYANSVGLPKSATHSKTKFWAADSFYNLIKNPIYYGRERWRFKTVIKTETTGCSRPVRAEDDYVEYRDMPHLAHVSKALWDKANATIANRCTHHNVKSGPENANYGVSRKDDPTRLGAKLRCWICGGNIRRRGPITNGIYTCGKILTQSCWNGTQTVRAMADRALKKAVLAELRKCFGMADSIVEKVQEISRDGGELSDRLKALEKGLADNDRKISNIMQAIEDGNGSPALAKRLAELERQKSNDEEECRQLRQQLTSQKRVFSAADIRATIDKAIKELEQADNRQLQILIYNLIAEGWFVPYRRFDNKKFILRCWIRLNFAVLLPHQWRDSRELYEACSAMNNVSKWICVDLNEDTYSMEFLQKYHELWQQGLGAYEIGKRLNVPRTTGRKRYAYYEQFLASGLDNAFLPMLDAPVSMGRYKVDPNISGLRGKSVEELEALVTDPTSWYLITSQ